MKVVKHTARRPRLREAHAGLTRTRIEDALLELLEEGGAVEAITFKAVAERAGVTEMTVYRYFPSREELLAGLWTRLNREMGPEIGMPDGSDGLLAQHADLYAGFDRLAAQIMASLTTQQGREMRAALNPKRRKAFLAIVDELNGKLGGKERTRAAAVLQLLHSAYAWASLREQWGLSGAEAGKATRWALEVLFDHLRRAK